MCLEPQKQAFQTILEIRVLCLLGRAVSLDEPNSLEKSAKSSDRHPIDHHGIESLSQTSCLGLVRAGVIFDHARQPAGCMLVMALGEALLTSQQITRRRSHEASGDLSSASVPSQEIAHSWQQLTDSRAASTLAHRLGGAPARRRRRLGDGDRSPYLNDSLREPAAICRA